jgi:hypothetical protein
MLRLIPIVAGCLVAEELPRCPEDYRVEINLWETWTKLLNTFILYTW